MAFISNKKGHNIGDKKGIYPAQSVSADNLSAEVIDSVNVVQMDGLGIGIFNANTTGITINIVMANNETSAPMPITIAGGELWQGAFYNAVVVAGSTGHLDSTTYYLYA